MRGNHWREYGTAFYWVYMRSGLQGVMFPGCQYGGYVSDSFGAALAPAVCDDFGNLMVVGEWH